MPQPNEAHAKELETHGPQPSPSDFTFQERAFSLQLEMLSDWHVGSGTARPGSVDRLVARDADDLPFVPAKSLTGIWRDACETLTYALDDGAAGAWSSWVDVIFGTQPALSKRDDLQLEKPLPALLEVRPAFLNDELREHFRRLREFDDARQKYFDERAAQKDLNAREENQTAPDELDRIEAGDVRVLFDALTFVKPGVRIDEHSGQARPDFLRFAEMNRAGTILRAECRLSDAHLDAHSRRTVGALLRASVLLIERLGGKRRRGAGSCRAELRINNDDKNNLNEALAWLETAEILSAENQLPLRAEAATDFRFDSQTSDAEASNLNRADEEAMWWSVPLAVELKMPVTIASNTLGNVTETLDFIPGTYLLPHVTQALKTSGYDARAAVACGEMIVTHATIEIDGARGWPVPFVLAEKKSIKDNTLFNRLRGGLPPNTQLKPLREGYFVPHVEGQNATADKLKIKRCSVRQSVLTHNTIKDDVQRPTSDVGGIFSREAIAAGQTLRAELRCSEKVHRELQCKGEWWKNLAGSYRIGTSRKDDYGLCKIKVAAGPHPFTSPLGPKHEPSPDARQINHETAADEQSGDAPPVNAQTVSQAEDDAPRGSRRSVIVWLLSDVLLRGVGLRAATEYQLLRSAIERRLRELSGTDDLSLSVSDDVGGGEQLKILLRPRRIESWHEGWGLPRPSLLGLAAGSCAVFQVGGGGQELAAQLRRLEAEGIGERRGEGYGQVSFNSFIFDKHLETFERSAAPAVAPQRPSPPTNLDASTADLAREIERAAWRESLLRAAVEVAAEPLERERIFGMKSANKDGELISKPPLSQLAGLRSALRHLRGDETDETKRQVRIWIEHLEKTENRARKWKDDEWNAIKRVRKVLRLDGRADENADVWQLLGAHWRRRQPLALTPNAERDLKGEFWAEAVRTLYDACLRSHKRLIEKQNPKT